MLIVVVIVLALLLHFFGVWELLEDVIRVASVLTIGFVVTAVTKLRKHSGLLVHHLQPVHVVNFSRNGEEDAGLTGQSFEGVLHVLNTLTVESWHRAANREVGCRSVKTFSLIICWEISVHQRIEASWLACDDSLRVSHCGASVSELILGDYDVSGLRISYRYALLTCRHYIIEVDLR